MSDPTVPAVAAPEPTTSTTDWRSGIPEDIRGEKFFESFKDVGGLAKTALEGQRMIGAGLTKLPGKDAKPEDIATWKQSNWSKLAEAGLIELAPESADKYEITAPEGSTLQLDEKMSASFKKVAHELGLSQRQVAALAAWQAGQIGESQSALKESAKATEATLRKEWGAAYDRNLGLAQRTVVELGGQDALDVFERTGTGNHPAVLKLFAKVGALLAEDGAITTDTEGNVLSESDAKAKITAIKNDRNHPYFSREAPGHKDAVEEMRRLHELAYPTL